MVSLARERQLKKPLLEGICREFFKVNLCVTEIVFNDVSTGKYSRTTVFKDDREEVYALCLSDEPLVLADIRNIISSMGMKAQEYLPPDADYEYFSRNGRKIFESVFPDRKITNDQEITFYKTLAPYSPALVRISQIHPEVREYNDIRNQWQNSMQLSYASR